MTKYIYAALAVLVVAAVMLALYFRASAAVSADRQHQAETRATQLGAALKQSEAVRAQEHAQASQFQAIAQQYEQDKAHAEADSQRLAADLRAERVRLRPEWRCDVPQAQPGAGKPDAAADDRAASAARVVRAAADADSQIRRLQEILMAERQ